MHYRLRAHHQVSQQDPHQPNMQELMHASILTPLLIKVFKYSRISIPTSSSAVPSP